MNYCKYECIINTDTNEIIYDDINARCDFIIEELLNYNEALKIDIQRLKQKIKDLLKEDRAIRFSSVSP